MRFLVIIVPICQTVVFYDTVLHSGGLAVYSLFLGAHIYILRYEISFD